MIQKVAKWEKTTKSIKRTLYKAKFLDKDGKFVKPMDVQPEDPHRDADVSGRMICNHIIRMCAKRYCFDDEALKTMALLELMFGKTIL